MDYAMALIDWYELTLEIIAIRLSEFHKKEISSDDVGMAIKKLNGFTDNTELHAILFRDGLNLYKGLETYNF